MLLSRKIGEEIVIGDDIIVTVIDIKGQQCRIGVSADSNVSIHRREIYDRLSREGGVHSFAGKNKANQARFCDCCGDLAPGLTCKWVNPEDNELCSYKGDEHCEHME